MSASRKLSVEQVSALEEAMGFLEYRAMNTLRRTAQDVRLIREDDDSEDGTVHEALADIVSDVHRVYAALAELGLRPAYLEWEG